MPQLVKAGTDVIATTTGQGSLAGIVAKVDAERAADAASEGGASADAKARHLALIREAGRAAIEETLLSPTRDDTEKLSEMSAEALASEWLAYAEVYGSNGLAAGGARSGLRPEVSAAEDRSAAAPTAAAEPEAAGPGLTRNALAAAVVVLVLLVTIQRARR